MPWLCCYQPPPKASANQNRAAPTVPPAATDELKPRHKALIAFADAGHSPGFGYTLALDHECIAYLGENDALDDACYYAIADRRAQSKVAASFPE